MNIIHLVFITVLSHTGFAQHAQAPFTFRQGFLVVGLFGLGFSGRKDRV